MYLDHMCQLTEVRGRREESEEERKVRYHEVVEVVEA